MSSSRSAFQRAFALADTGEFEGMHDIRRRLDAEGVDTTELQGSTCRRQIHQRCLAAEDRKRI
jgi:hypothetical protein